MTTLSTIPAFPPPSSDIQIRFALTQAGANFVRVWVTDAPPGSELRGKLAASAQNRFPFHEGDGGEAHPVTTRFDVGGKYTFVAQEYSRGASNYGGGYQRSPDGAPSETKLGAEVTLELFIGQRMISTIAAGSDQISLVLWVWGDRIQGTSNAVHGEDTPAIQSASGTPRANAVAESRSASHGIVAALAALRGTLVSDAIGSPQAVLADLVAKWNAHMTESGGVHNANDGDNAIPAGLANAATPDGLAQVAGEILSRVRQHYTNDPVLGGSLAGRDKASYHQLSGTKRNDNASMPVISGAGGAQDAYWLIADLCRSYEAHRVSLAVHGATGAAALAALPPIMQIGRLVLGMLSSTDPVVPTTQSTGAMQLISRAGFSEEPL